jgi:LuxR family transcriptional regulator, maltose regulon positive regulatory protein
MTLCASSSPLFPSICVPERLRLPPQHLPRPRLQQLLLARDCRLRLVLAPAGFGKSVLLNECARLCPPDCELLWLNLAGQACSVLELERQLARALGYGETLQVGELAGRLSQENRRLWIMLNDYPRTPDTELDAYLERLLGVSPASLNWWLASRRRPACNLPRLLLEGELLEVGVAELAFSSEELRQWLQVSGIADQCLTALWGHSAGWIAALRLLTLEGELQGGAANGLLNDYIEHEVLGGLPAELVQALRNLAHIPRFNGSLCDHLLGVGEGAAWLQALRERGLFIQECAGAAGWFEVFAPMARLLQRQPVSIPCSALHVHASQWFGAQGDIRAAVEHALLAGQPEVASSFLERFTEEQVLQGQDLALILRWRSELPDSLLSSSPRLILLNAWVLLLVGRLDEAQDCIDQLARFQPRSNGPRTRELFAHWQAVQGIIAYGRVCAVDAREHLQQALQGLPASAWAQSLLCRSTLTQVAIGEGNLEQAQKLSHEALQQARQCSNPVFEALLELDHALLLEARGEFARAEALLQRVLASTQQRALHNTPALGRMQARLGRLLLRQGRHAEASIQLQHSLESSLACGDPGAFFAYLGQAELAMGGGDIAGAFSCLAQAERLMQRQRVNQTLYRGTLLLASSHLWVAQGHYQRARQAATRVLDYAQKVKAVLPTPNFPELIPRLQALLLQLDREQGEDVREPLRQLIEQAQGQGRQALVSELWLNYAEACSAFGDQAGADQARQAGQALRQRLGYQCLWFTVAGMESVLAPAVSASATATLSSRELAVLTLIAQGLSNQEVAERLFISLHTVKTHARRINGKLGVARRTQAVAQAKVLGLL